MKKTQDKVIRPKYNAIYTLQFWRDKEGTLNVTETANVGSIDDLSMYIHGQHIAKSKFLDKSDKYAFAQFCLSFVNKWNEMEDSKGNGQ